MFAYKTHQQTPFVQEPKGIRALLDAYQGALPEAVSTWPADVQTLYAYLLAHLFDEGSTIATAKVACRLHDNNISSKFSYHVGETPAKFCTQHRVAAAKQIIQAGFNIAEASYAVGYASRSAFYKAFQRMEGRSPVKFKKSVQKNVSTF